MRSSAPRGRRIGAYVASAVLTLSGSLSGAVLAAGPADAVLAHDPTGVDQGAGWLSAQLDGGVVHNDRYDFDDLGLTADIALALDAVGGHEQEVGDVVDALEPRAHDEWYTSTFHDVTTTYAGSLAKMLVLAQVAGADPTSFGGQDLVTLLGERVATAAPITGRIENENDDFGDANTIGQAYAARGLAAAGASQASDALDFLLEQQCSSGYFRLGFTADKTDPDQSCTDGADDPDTDATAIAVLELAPQSADGAVAAAISKARAWLVDQQQDDGSFGGGTTTEAPNANSTGLAAWALGDGPQAQRAAQWLRAHQVSYFDVCDRLHGERGAVAYDDSALSDGRADGISTGAQDQWRRASAQAVPGLAYLPQDATPADPELSGPDVYLKAGAHPYLTVTGVHAGDRLCLNGVGALAQGTATGSTWRTAVTLPAGTRTRGYGVRDADGHVAITSVKVLGRRKLTVTRTPGRVGRSHQVTVAARGLAPHEYARIFYGRSLVRSGQASSSGNLVARFDSGRSLGWKRIRAYGRFPDIRKGATTVKVVR